MTDIMIVEKMQNDKDYCEIRYSLCLQLAPNTDNNAETGFPDVRWQQTIGYGYTPNPVLQKVFTAVACDLPDFYSPHGAYVSYVTTLYQSRLYGKFPRYRFY